MELISNRLSQYKIKSAAKPKIFTKEQSLADEIYFHFHKRIAFPRLMSMIKRKGYQFTYEVFNLVRHSDCHDPVALFIWKIEKEKSVQKSYPQ